MDPELPSPFTKMGIELASPNRKLYPLGSQKVHF